MKLLDLYVNEVGRRLALVKGRKDIENELCSTLEDMLEDRANRTGKPADEAMALELLKEYGSPQNTAETYNPNPYLIGPRMFPMFVTVLKIVFAAVALGLSIATIVEIVNLSPASAADVFSAIGRGLMNMISACIGAFGNVALIFALIERFAPASDIKLGEEKEWDPASLLKEPEPQDVKMWEPIFAIVFTFIALSIFNFNPELIAFYNFNGEEWQKLPLLSDAFFRLMPLINVGWIAEIVLNGILLRNGRWDTITRLGAIGIKLFQIVILALMISGPSILALTPDVLATSGINDSEAVKVLGMLSNTGIRIALGLGVFGSVVEVIKSAYKLMNQKQQN